MKSLTKSVTKSVIKLSEIPKELQDSIELKWHPIHTYLEFHINDDTPISPLCEWLIKNYPSLKRKISFLIHIDKQQDK